MHAPLPSPHDPPPTSGPRGSTTRRDIGVALACGVFVGLMVGAAYASVPLYNWFCRVTGFGGTTQVAAAAPAETLDRRITVRFDANISRGLPWKFEPEQTSIDVRLGEVVTVYYTVTNLAARETVGTASYNVAPTTVGAYFSKINCFCFTEQRLKAGERREMAVVFFVEPSLARDADQDDLNTITLSYTFYPTREPATASAARSGGS
ncbi:cytochrome c oxidase assembly protein [Rhodoplanes roseus]|uniref:Cytochrome c oxidase assembly protein CtaG n=2 Tax=Rhodoplanes roseus TaxID=29409 RepID=A0A327L5F1_9BRAD|nr:cytochrome c oxidase assembly protein [Rhodoplanes roseus]RAI45586.1 cytochrome c oxidase assembly protein [Rhodoplanes roseus]